jgi:signal transduction histidine kinase
MTRKFSGLKISGTYKSPTSGLGSGKARPLGYITLFRLAPDSYLVTNPRGKILMASRAARDLLNLPTPPGVQLSAFVAREDRHLLREVLSQMKHRDHSQCTLRLHPRKGSNRADAAAISGDASIAAIRDGTALKALGWIIRDVTDARRAQEELKRKCDELRRLVTEVSLAEERERRRLATVVHDCVSQPLAMATLLLASARDGIVPENTERLNEANGLLSQAIEQCRILASELSPSILYELGLGPALEWMAEQTQRRHGLKIRVSDGLAGQTIGILTRVTLFGAIRELLGGIIQRSRSSRVWISLSRSRRDHGIRADIREDGKGIDAGVGLSNVQARLEQMGGRLTTLSDRVLGTRVELWAPLSELLPSATDSAEKPTVRTPQRRHS